MREFALALGYRAASGVQRYFDESYASGERAPAELRRRLVEAVTAGRIPNLGPSDLDAPFLASVRPPSADRIANSPAFDEPDVSADMAVPAIGSREEAPAVRSAPEPVPASSVEAGSRPSLIPLHGLAADGQRSGQTHWKLSGTLARVPCPHHLEGNDAVFAVYAPDDAYAPAIRAGDILFVDPLRPPMEGRIVLVGFEDGTMVLGTIAENRMGYLVVEAPGGRERLRITAEMTVRRIAVVQMP